MQSLKSWASRSYGYEQRIEMFFRHWQPIFLEREDISLYGLPDIGNRFLLRAALTDATL